MSIFGTQHPKIVVNLDTTRDEIDLLYAVVLKDEPELDSYDVKAVRTGKKVFTNAGKHWIFQVKIHLWKYADPKAKYLELKSYEGTDVILYRRADGDAIYDTYGNEGRFILLPTVESYTDEKNKYDVLTLTFKSLNYIIKDSATPSSMTAYLMNAVNDTPQGSITSGVNNSGQLYDYRNIPNDYVEKTAKVLIGNGSMPITTVNGFKVLRYNSGYSNYGSYYFYSYFSDIFNGANNATVLMAFNCDSMNAYGNHRTLFNHYNSARSVQIKIYLDKANGNLTAMMTDGTNAMTASLGADYSDKEWHIVAVVFNLQNKVVSIYDENGNKHIVSNQSFVPVSLESNLSRQPQIGYVRTPSNTDIEVFGSRENIADYEHYIGDILIFNEVLTTAQINIKGRWMANRLGITWNNIV